MNFVPITCLMSNFDIRYGLVTGFRTESGGSHAPLPRVTDELCIILWGPKNRFYRGNICLGDWDFIFKILKQIRAKRFLSIEYLVWPLGSYLNRYEIRWKTQNAKGQSVICWRYLALDWLKSTLPPHQQIDKQTPSSRSERNEGSGEHWSPTFRREPEPDLPPVHDKKIWWQRARRDSPSTPATANK